jgi:cytochrome c-type biogenesis protein CcsB
MDELSNHLLVVAVLGYVAAMVGHLVEYAFGQRGAVARAAARAPRQPRRELVAVGAGPTGGAPDVARPHAEAPEAGGPDAEAPEAVGSGAGTPEARGPGAGTPVRSPGVTGWAGRLAVALTGVAALAHAGVLVTRGLAAHRVPWGNMYEFVVAGSLVAAVTWLVLVVRRPSLRLLGLFASLIFVVVLGYAGMVLYTEAAPLVPALNSYWLKIHVSAAALSSGLFMVGAVPALMYLVRSGHDAGRRRFPYGLGRVLPPADVLERLTFRLHTFAFPIWTFAVVCGAIWAEAAWGRYWAWDPKETWSFVSWVAYAAYLHARATPSVRRTTATWFAVAAWTTMLINLYVINFLVVGLHSYAGVD